ncbi:MAG: proline iminopeptidase-family hydrolase [Promethearchaeota archaeon]|jgi:proline-specific peptidase
MQSISYKKIQINIERGNKVEEAKLLTKEGFVSFRGYNVWYGIVGEREEPGKLPLLCLNGGPGAPHDYLEPLGEMETTGRRVIFYDQLGSGNSDHPHDPKMWTVELFVEELGVLRRELGLENVHLFGHSWGGMLAMEYALTQPKGLASLILANALADYQQWIAETNQLRSKLPSEVQQTLLELEESGNTDNPAYEEAVLVFYRRHFCRLDPWPDCLNRSFEKLEQNPEVYNTMNGPSEFHITGSLKNWSIVHRLPEIRVPTLLLSGRYDETTPAIIKTIHDGIPDSEWIIFENSSHTPHLEESKRYIQVLSDFLKRVEI